MQPLNWANPSSKLADCYVFYICLLTNKYQKYKSVELVQSGRHCKFPAECHSSHIGAIHPWAVGSFSLLSWPNEIWQACSAEMTGWRVLSTGQCPVSKRCRIELVLIQSHLSLGKHWLQPFLGCTRHSRLSETSGLH